ncbi:hypothetical protein B0H14DRAFT_3433052 [Mycena olivaceomarginata]|nr:hypothetical protein B0H14DRAFT_3433052 [Mycena olivaceomarginata]
MKRTLKRAQGGLNLRGLARKTLWEKNSGSTVLKRQASRLPRKIEAKIRVDVVVKKEETSSHVTPLSQDNALVSAGYGKCA